MFKKYEFSGRSVSIFSTRYLFSVPTVGLSKSVFMVGYCGNCGTVSGCQGYTKWHSKLLAVPATSAPVGRVFRGRTGQESHSKTLSDLVLLSVVWTCCNILSCNKKYVLWSTVERVSAQRCCIPYTVIEIFDYNCNDLELHCLKKGPTCKLSVTLSNLNRFSKFLHYWKAYKIRYKTNTKLPTSP